MEDDDSSDIVDEYRQDFLFDDDDDSIYSYDYEEEDEDESDIEDYLNPSFQIVYDEAKNVSMDDSDGGESDESDNLESILAELESKNIPFDDNNSIDISGPNISGSEEDDEEDYDYDSDSDIPDYLDPPVQIVYEAKNVSMSDRDGDENDNVERKNVMDYRQDDLSDQVDDSIRDFYEDEDEDDDVESDSF